MGSYMFSISPNENGEIEAVAQKDGVRIDFKITETDLKRMLRSIHVWKIEKIDESQAYGNDCRGGQCT